MRLIKIPARNATDGVVLADSRGVAIVLCAFRTTRKKGNCVRQRVLLAAVALFVAACSTDTTHPGSSGLLSLAATGGQGGGSMMPNGVAYGNGGVHPATGRSGSAAITASAVYAGTGTVLTVTSYHRNDLSFLDPTGDIVKLQVKAFSAAGALLWTRNFTNLAPAASIRTLTFTDADVGGRLQVQANVRSIDPRRTDVVVTSSFVVARPANLRVGPVQAEDRWLLNIPLAISATVTETGGDLNVTATCALYVDGVKVDHIDNMLVLAGDMVTCNFVHTFTTVGAHEVRVKVEGMMPGDNNSLDNQTAGRVDVYAPDGVPLPTFNFTADIGDEQVDAYDSSRTTITDLLDGSLVNDDSYVSSSVGRDQFSSFVGTYYGQVAFPLARLVLIQRSGGTVVHGDTLTNLAENGIGTIPCTNGSASGGVQYSLCSYPISLGGYTVLQYTRQAGSVAYRSQAYNHLLDGEPCFEVDGCWVTLSSVDEGVVDWAASLDYEVAITAGDTVYAAAPSIPLSPSSQDSAYGPTCESAILSDSTFLPIIGWVKTNQEVRTCRQGHINRAGIVGTGAGIGSTELSAVP